MNIKKLEYGIHTIEINKLNVKYREAQKLIEYLADHGKIMSLSSDSYNINRQYASTYLADYGIQMRIRQTYDKSNTVSFAINLSTFRKGKYAPIKLYRPSPDDYSDITDFIGNFLVKSGIYPINHDEDYDMEEAKQNLSLSYIELTCNLHFDQEVVIPEFIRLFRKAYIPHNFKEIRQKDSDDPLINDHIFVMKTAGVIVKAYDKIYELKKKGHCPKKLAKENILRIEVGLHRKEFLRKFKLSKDEAPYYILRLCYKNVIPEIFSYLSKLFPSSGTHIPYKKAGKLIENNVADALLKEQMTFLLKAASDSDTLTAATHKLKKFYNKTYNNVNGKRLKRIFKEFNNIDVNPICLLESTKSKEIPSMTNLMDDYFAKKKQHTK